MNTHNPQTAYIEDTKLINTGIEQQERKAASKAMETLLASTYSLYLKTQYYHWNVVGMPFYALHQMFEEQYKELAEAIDELAERIRALGKMAPGTFRDFSELSSIEEDQFFPKDWQIMVRNLVDGHEEIVKQCREVINKVKHVNDEVTIDILTKRMFIHEKTSWMLRSTLGTYIVVPPKQDPLTGVKKQNGDEDK